MIYRLLVVPALVLATSGVPAIAQGDSPELRDYVNPMLAATPMTYPDAPMPGPNVLIPPADENRYFPVRPDGQPYTLQTDETVNITDELNRFYYNPAWRGEVWSPYQNFLVVEKGVRLMSLWPEYDSFSQWKNPLLTNIHQFFERWSGFGP